MTSFQHVLILINRCIKTGAIFLYSNALKIKMQSGPNYVFGCINPQLGIGLLRTPLSSRVRVSSTVFRHARQCHLTIRVVVCSLVFDFSKFSIRCFKFGHTLCRSFVLPRTNLPLHMFVNFKRRSLTNSACTTNNSATFLRVQF